MCNIPVPITCILNADTNSDFFTIKVFHGGRFSEEKGRKCYVGGTVSYFDWNDKDKMSLIELDDIAKRLGYADFVGFHYRNPAFVLDGGFKMMHVDEDVLDMVGCVEDHVVEMYMDPALLVLF